MRKAILVLLVLSALLVADTEGWRVFRKVKDAVKKAGQKVGQAIGKGVTKVKDFVDKHKDKIKFITGLFGRKKRSVDETDTNARMAIEEILSELELQCPGFGIGPNDSVDQQTIIDAFLAADSDGDGTLDDEEIEEFENIIDLYYECIELQAR